MFYENINLNLFSSLGTVYMNNIHVYIKNNFKLVTSTFLRFENKYLLKGVHKINLLSHFQHFNYFDLCSWAIEINVFIQWKYIYFKTLIIF